MKNKNDKESLVKELEKLEKENEKLKTELNYYKSIEDSLKSSLLKAEKEADDVRRTAREESTIIIKDAKTNANRIVNDALVEAEKIEIKKENIEKNMKVFKRKLKLIIEQQMAVAEEIEDIELE